MPALTNPRFITRLKAKGFDENEPIDLQAMLECAESLEIWDNENKCVVDPKDPEIQRLMFEEATGAHCRTASEGKLELRNNS